MIRTLLAIVTILLVSEAATAAEPSVPEEVLRTAASLRDSAIQGTRAFELVSSLTTEAGPRLAGSRGDALAVEWAVRTLPGLGLDDVRAEPVTVPHWERGRESGRIVSPWPEPVALCALGGSVGTPEGGIEAEVIEAESLRTLDKMEPGTAKGKIVFLSLRMPRTPDGAGYGVTVPIRTQGASKAARLGAVALLIRSVGTDQSRMPHTGGMRYEEDIPRIPAAALSNPDADLLQRQLASGKPVVFRLELSCRMLPDTTSANVIAEVRGRERPEEIVLLGAHLDSWDLGQGAIDDGAGCAIVIEAARRIAALPRRPRRTTRVVLFANEEWGLSGAKEYLTRHEWEMPEHVVATEADFGAGRVWRFSSRVEQVALPLIHRIHEALRPIGIERGDNDAGGGADLSPLAPCRIPIVDLEQDGTLYFDVHHTANDTLDKVDPKDLDQNVAAMAAFAYIAAETPESFGRAPEPE